MSLKNCFLVNAWHRSVKWSCHYVSVVYLLAECSIFFPGIAQAFVFDNAQVESQFAYSGLQLGHTVLQKLPTVAWPIDWVRVETGQNLVDGVMEKLPSVFLELPVNSVVGGINDKKPSNQSCNDSAVEEIKSFWVHFLAFITGMVLAILSIGSCERFFKNKLKRSNQANAQRQS